MTTMTGMRAHIEVSRKRGVFTAWGLAARMPENGKRKLHVECSRIKQDAIDQCRVALEEKGWVVAMVYDAMFLI